MDATLTNNNDRTASIVYWTLRHGDFRPETVDCNITCFYPDEKTMLDQLAKAGNLFECEQDAIEASIAVRAELNRLKFIRQERREYDRRNARKDRCVVLPKEIARLYEILNSKIDEIIIDHKP